MSTLAAQDLDTIIDRCPDPEPPASLDDLDARLAWTYRATAAFATLRREHARMRAALLVQRELWQLSVATAATRATFVAANDPIGRIDAALGDVAV